MASSQPDIQATFDSSKTKASSVFLVCFMAALAGLLFGLDQGVISGALPFITHAFKLTTSQQEWVVSIMMFGAAVGAIGSGWLSHHFGRKYCLLIGAVLFVLGSILSAISPSIAFLMFSRIILGLAVGIASYTAPLYLSEIAPEKIRGSMISMYQLMIIIGILLAFISDTLFSYSGAWRWMLGIILIPAIVLFIGVFFLPRSPRWLTAHGRDQEARLVLAKLRQSSTQVEKEYSDIKESLKLNQGGWSLFTSNKHFRRAVFLGILLQVIQQFTGFNVVMYYAPKIFSMAGFANTEQQMWGTVIVGIVNVLATLIAVALADKWGRKPILIVGFIIMTIGMGIVGTMLEIGITSVAAQYFAIIMVLVFCAGFCMSAGPIIWILCSEIQPLKGKDFGITCSTATNWIANMIVGATFLSMLNCFGQSQTFWIYAILNVIFLVIIFILIPETKNVPLEHIERNLMEGKPLRHIGKTRETHH